MMFSPISLLPYILSMFKGVDLSLQQGECNWLPRIWCHLKKMEIFSFTNGENKNPRM